MKRHISSKKDIRRSAELAAHFGFTPATTDIDFEALHRCAACGTETVLLQAVRTAGGWARLCNECVEEVSDGNSR